MVVDAASPVDASDDPDGDRMRGACDLCPNDPETYNGILDEDGCPDSSGQSHAVIGHPTNRLAWPLVIHFDGDKPTVPLRTWLFDDDVEVLHVIARSDLATKPALAKKRAALVAKHLRAYLSKVRPDIRIDEQVTGASELYVDDEVSSTDDHVLIQVMRARDVEIWRWENDQLVRATPRARLVPAKLPPGC